MPVVWMGLGAALSYFLSDKMRKRWVAAAAAYAWLQEEKERMDKTIAMQVYQWYCDGTLDKLIKQGYPKDNPRPPKEYIDMCDKALLSSVNKDIQLG